MFSVFKVLYPTSSNNEVTLIKLRDFLISRVIARTGSLPPSPCECAHRVWHQGPNKMNLKYFQIFSCMAYNCFVRIKLYYWTLAHIVHVVVTAGKQPTTWDMMDGNVLAWDWWDSRWERGTLTASFRMPLLQWFKFCLSL